MKTFKYIILGVLMAILSLSSMTELLGQKGSIEFLETYSYSEIISHLDPGDRLFQLVDANQSDPESSKLGICNAEKAAEVWKYLQTESFLNQLPNNTRFAWGVREKEEEYLTLFALKQPGKAFAGPDQSDIEEMAIQKDNKNESFGLFISFSEDGAEKWETLTGKNVNRNIAIVIEGKVYAAPIVREKIKQGECVISGNFSKKDVSRLKELLEKPTN
ncbi:MAG: hypothetical protein ABFS38_17355 [Bacteroidota bacterium]